MGEYMRRISLVTACLGVIAPGFAHACTSCFGSATGREAEGITFAIMTLGGVLFLVLSAFTYFFCRLASRAAKSG